MKKKLENIKQKHSVTTETQEYAIGKITIVRKKSFKFLRDAIKWICLIFVIGIISSIVTIAFLKSSFFTGLFNEKLASSNSTNIINTQYNNLIFNAIESVTPSLVTITNEETPSLEIKNVENNIPTFKMQKVTGVAITADGYIITAYSNIKNFKNIYVNVPNVNNKSFKATLVGSDNVTNIAVLKIDFNKLVPINTTDRLTQGEFVFAIGNTSGEEGGSVATMGIVSNPDKIINMIDKHDMIVKTGVIESDLNIGESTEGGVLINLQGEVVGFNTFVNTQKNSLAKSISVRYTTGIVNQIINTGEVQRVFIGIKGIPATNSDGGYYIQNIEEGGCAYKPGIRVGDTIYELNGKKINCVNDMVDALKGAKINEVVPVIIIRDGKKINIDMKLSTEVG